MSRKKRTESTFDYLNRSARCASDAERGLVETWLSRVPATEHTDFCARFRCGDDRQFTSALQELTLHELLRRQRCILTFHPTLPGTSKQPDFTVQQPKGSAFLLEACTSIDSASGPTGGTRAHRIRDFLDTLDRAYLLAIDKLTEGSKDLSQRLLTRHIEAAIQAAKPGYCKGSIAIPPLTTADGWNVKLTAIPKTRYGNRRSAIRQENWSRTWSGLSYPLRVSLKKKGGRYGNQLAMPYVIAVNSADVMLTDRDFQDTLFGGLSQFAAPGEPPDRGFWGTAAAPSYTRVSAVLFTKNLCPATLLMGQVHACLYLNPWAAHPYDGVLTELTTFRFECGGLREHAGAPVHTLLRLRLLDAGTWG